MAYDEDYWPVETEFMQTAIQWARCFDDNPPSHPFEVLTWLDPRFDGIKWVRYEFGEDEKD